MDIYKIFNWSFIKIHYINEKVGRLKVINGVYVQVNVVERLLYLEMGIMYGIIVFIRLIHGIYKIVLIHTLDILDEDLIDI